MSAGIAPPRLASSGGIARCALQSARTFAPNLTVAAVLGPEGVRSQSTLWRFFAQHARAAAETTSGLHAWVLQRLPERWS